MKRRHKRTRDSSSDSSSESTTSETRSSKSEEESSEQEDAPQQSGSCSKNYEDAILARKGSKVKIRNVNYKYRHECDAPSNPNKNRGVIEAVDKFTKVIIGQVTAKRTKINDSPPKVPADSKVFNIAEHGVKQININRDKIKIKHGKAHKRQISKVVDQADEKSSNQASEETTTIDVAGKSTDSIFNKRCSDFVDFQIAQTTAFAKRKITFRVKEETFSIGRRLLLEKAPHMETLLIPNDTTVLIENAEPEIFKAMLYFIQYGSIMFKTINRLQATSLLEMAVKYKLDKLKQLLCDDFFLNTITHETVVDYLILAYEHNMEALKTKAFEYVKNHPEIEESEMFHKIIKSSNVQLKKDWFIMA